MNWISVEKELPTNGSYLVSFLIEILGKGYDPFDDKRLYAAGHFDRLIGWRVENRYIEDMRYDKRYISPLMRVTHWMPLPFIDFIEEKE